MDQYSARALPWLSGAIGHKLEGEKRICQEPLPTVRFPGAWLVWVVANKQIFFLCK